MGLRERMSQNLKYLIPSNKSNRFKHLNMYQSSLLSETIVLHQNIEGQTIKYQ